MIEFVALYVLWGIPVAVVATTREHLHPSAAYIRPPTRAQLVWLFVGVVILWWVWLIAMVIDWETWDGDHDDTDPGPFTD